MIKPIKNEQDYDLVLKKMETVFHAKPNTPEGDLLEVLSMLLHEYEQKHYKIETLTPIEALKEKEEEHEKWNFLKDVKVLERLKSIKEKMFLRMQVRKAKQAVV